MSLINSAGGNLALALLQLILHLSQANHLIPLPDGSHRPIPLPGGVAVNSPWLDVTHSSPSCTANAAFDYLPTPAQQREAALKRPRCAAWPADPPRKNIYVADALVSHPLVTLLLAPSWRGAPPVYLCTGWELLADEDRHAARCMWRDGVRVVFEEYEAMPHCFGLALPYLKETRRCLDAWAGFIKGVVESGPQGVADEGGSRFVRIRAKTLEEERIEPAELCAEDEQAVEERFLRNMNGGLSTEVGIAKL
jgi:acetyl esterase/lipase